MESRAEPALPTARRVTPPPIAEEYAKEVRRRLGDRVLRVVLFGSHARGDAWDGSDYDFAIMLDGPVATGRGAILDAGVTLLNQREALCAAIVYDRDQWARMLETPLGWNVQREGIVL